MNRTNAEVYTLAGSAISHPYLHIVGALLILVAPALATAYFTPYEIDFEVLIVGIVDVVK